VAILSTELKQFQPAFLAGYLARNVRTPMLSWLFGKSVVRDSVQKICQSLNNNPSEWEWSTSVDSEGLICINLEYKNKLKINIYSIVEDAITNPEYSALNRAERAAVRTAAKVVQKYHEQQKQERLQKTLDQF
jgi:hypothetical protein